MCGGCGPLGIPSVSYTHLDVYKRQDHSCKEAEAAVKEQLEAGLPVPFLMLKHKDSRRFQDFIWHWFLLIGYEGEGEKMTVTAATYGEAVKLPFYDFWDTGYAEKGGMILYSLS